MTVFADTFALLAWLNPDDAHAAVVAHLDGFTGRLLTTEWVLMELADALSAPEARSATVAFLLLRRAQHEVQLPTDASQRPNARHDRARHRSRHPEAAHAGINLQDQFVVLNHWR